MKLDFVELPNLADLRAGAQFADWEREAINGNSLGIFLWAGADHGKPGLQEFFLRDGAQCIGRVSPLRDTPEVLASLCPGYEGRALFGHICLNRLVLREEGSISVLATDAAGDRHHVGSIEFSGNRIEDCIPEKADLGIRPILVSSLGRSGSTVLANSLGLHPGVANLGGYPFEYRHFSYCLHATYVLTSPANHAYSMGGDAFENRNHFNIGFNPFNHRDYDHLLGDDRLRSFFEAELPRVTARFFMDQARFAIARGTAGKPGAVAFVEKMGGTHLSNLAANVCAGVREIVLVRDFWDMAASMIAFDAKRGTTGFFAATSKADADAWLVALAFQHGHLANRSRLPGILSVSYEDLVRDPKASMAGLMEALGIATDAAALAAMMPAFGENPYSALHATGAREKIRFEATFSDDALGAVGRTLETNGRSVVPAAPERRQATWVAGRDEIDRFDWMGSLANLPAGPADALRSKWGGLLGFAIEQELVPLRKALEAERLAREQDRQFAEGEVGAAADRAAHAEAYNRALLNDLACVRDSYEQERAALEDRARRAEEYNRALLDEVARLSAPKSARGQ